MRFIGKNIKYDDCVLVALYNAAIAAGVNTTYYKIRKLSISKGWYAPGSSFECKYLDKAFAYLKIKGSLLSKVEPNKIFDSVINENKIYIFFRPSEWCLPGHAMVAVKGSKGVKVINPYICDTGWKSMSREIKNGHEHFAIEVTRAA